MLWFISIWQCDGGNENAKIEGDLQMNWIRLNQNPEGIAKEIWLENFNEVLFMEPDILAIQQEITFHLKPILFLSCIASLDVNVIN